jgi:glycosyltransferase involved in cell wall biosynthesis
MLSAGGGGLEQSLIDYCEALLMAGHPVTAVCHPDWPGRNSLDSLGAVRENCRSLGDWDPFAVARIRHILRRSDVALVFTIGRRATALTRRALGAPRPVPQASKTPNYRIDTSLGLDLVIATTSDLACALRAAGQSPERITIIPNMVRVPEDMTVAPARGTERPVIGALGRFVTKKGFLPFIDALALLERQGVPFSCRLAGDGEQARAVRTRIAEHNLGDRVELPGWIDDKRAFFAGIDLFCVPSLHEPFGIVVIEGFAHGLATVVTDAEGPREIVTSGTDGLLVPRNDPAALAIALRRLIEDPALRFELATNALAKARATYDLPVVGATVSKAFTEAVERFSRERSTAAVNALSSGSGKRRGV